MTNLRPWPQLLVVALLAVSSAAAPASAGPVSWEFVGQITTDEPGPLSELFALGTEVRFTVPIDALAADTCDSPTNGFYSMPGSALTVGGQTFTSDWTALEVHNPAGNCTGATTDSTLRLVAFREAPFFAASIGWFDPQPGDLFPAMPTAASAPYFFISYVFVVSPTVFGRIDTVRAVPEPHALTLLMVFGVIGACRLRPSRRQPALRASPTPAARTPAAR